MVSNPKPIPVMPETDWPKLLDEAVKGPVLLEHDGVVLRLVRAEKEEEDITAGYDPDPEAVRAMLATVAGSWAHLDTDQMIADLYAARRAGSRQPDRP